MPGGVAGVQPIMAAPYADESCMGLFSPNTCAILAFIPKRHRTLNCP